MYSTGSGASFESPVSKEREKKNQDFCPRDTSLGGKVKAKLRRRLL